MYACFLNVSLSPVVFGDSLQYRPTEIDFVLFLVPKTPILDGIGHFRFLLRVYFHIRFFRLLQNT